MRHWLNKLSNSVMEMLMFLYYNVKYLTEMHVCFNTLKPSCLMWYCERLCCPSSYGCWKWFQLPGYSYFKYRFAIIVFIMHEFMSWCCWSWISVSQYLLWYRRLMLWSHHYVVQYLRMYGHIWDHFLDEPASTFYTSAPPMCQNVLTSFYTAFSVGAFCTISAVLWTSAMEREIKADVN